jgi:hypothetical protein
LIKILSQIWEQIALGEGWKGKKSLQIKISVSPRKKNTISEYDLDPINFLFEDKNTKYKTQNLKMNGNKIIASREKEEEGK